MLGKILSYNTACYWIYFYCQMILIINFWIVFYSIQLVQNSLSFLLRSQTTWIYRLSCTVWPTYTPVSTTWNYSSVLVQIYRFSCATGKGVGNQHAQNRKCSQFLRPSNFYFFLLAPKYFYSDTLFGSLCQARCMLTLWQEVFSKYAYNLSVFCKKMPCHFEAQNTKTCGALLGQSPVHILAGAKYPHRHKFPPSLPIERMPGFFFRGT